MTPAEMTREHFAKLKAGASVTFPPWKQVWTVEKVVERGAILYKMSGDPHKHLAEWHELATAVIE